MVSLLQIDTPTWLTNYIHIKFEKAYKEILDTHTKKNKVKTFSWVGSQCPTCRTLAVLKLVGVILVDRRRSLLASL